MNTQQQTRTYGLIKKPRGSFALLLLLGAVSTSALSAGVGKINGKVVNNEFNNTGNINAVATASGGVSTALAGQRVIAPIAAGKFNYTSINDQFDNSGDIKAISTAAGGASTAMAGQVVMAPAAAAIVEHHSENNRYRKTGTIKATSTAVGGAATAIAAQDLTF